MAKGKVRKVLGISYDPEVDALYIQVGEGRISETIEVEDYVLLDVDSRGRVLGVEVLWASEKMPRKLLNLFKM